MRSRSLACSLGPVPHPDHLPRTQSRITQEGWTLTDRRLPLSSGAEAGREQAPLVTSLCFGFSQPPYVTLIIQKCQ